MDIHAKLHFNWEISNGKGKTARVEKFEEVWTITKVDDSGVLRLHSPNDDVFDLQKEDFNVANVIFQQYETNNRNSTVSLFIDNKQVFVYDVYDLIEKNYGETKDFALVLTLLLCYKGRSKFLSR